MINTENRLQPFLQLWIENIVITIVTIAIFSLFSQMSIGAIVTPVFVLLHSIISFKRLGAIHCIKKIRQHLLFYSLLALVIISALSGTHSVIDSFSYRFPQLLLWLQEGHPWSVPYVDMRINQMPHVWSFMIAPLFFIFREFGAAIPNMISFVLLYHLLLSFTPHSTVKKWFALIIVTTPIVLMQAASTDNVLTVITFLLISFYFSRQTFSTKSVVYSALAFALACGIKPQYSTLVPLWIFWFIYHLWKNKGVLRWSVAILIVPIVIICSPLPTFFINYTQNGSVTNPVVEGSIPNSDENSDEKSGGKSDAVQSYLCFINQMTALPINPLANVLTKKLERIPSETPVVHHLNKQRIYLIIVPEKASLSLIASIVLALGLIVALKKRGSRYEKVVAIGTLFALIVAIQVTTPYTPGRSFIGFVFLMIPLSITSLPFLSIRAMKCTAILAILGGITVILLNPARPLWPVHLIRNAITSEKLQSTIDSYISYSQKHLSGKSLVEQVPHNQSIGVIAEDGTPLLALWKPWSNRKVYFFPENVTAEDLFEQDVHAVILKHTMNSATQSLLDSFEENEIIEEEYISYIQRGKEKWYLLKR